MNLKGRFGDGAVFVAKALTNKNKNSHVLKLFSQQTAKSVTETCLEKFPHLRERTKELISDEVIMN